jgi:hypothetical protein
MEIGKGQTIAVVFGEPAGLAEPPYEAEPTLGPTRGLARAGRFVQHVSVDQLHQSLKDLTGALATVLAEVKAVGGYELSEVQVGVELTAEGGVRLIGNLTAGAKGALQLTFKPPTTQ